MYQYNGQKYRGNFTWNEKWKYVLLPSWSSSYGQNVPIVNLIISYLEMLQFQFSINQLFNLWSLYYEFHYNEYWDC